MLFQDNFSNDTNVFTYPDGSNSDLPGPTSGGGTWDIFETSPQQIQAGVIQNTLPGGGTGGADGNSNYMAIQRNSGQTGYADAAFSSPAGTSGNLSVQWDMYGVPPAGGHNNFVIFLSDTDNEDGNIGPYILLSNYNPPTSTDMEILSRAGPTAGTVADLGGFPDNAWIHMDMEVNLTAETYQLFINNTLVDQPNTGQNTFGYIDSGTVGPFKSLLFDGASAEGETLYVDNVDVDYTPPAPLSLTWNNAGGGSPSDGQTWDISNNNNWNNGSAASVYTDGANVTFNDANNATSNGGTNANAYNVTLSTTVSPGSVTVDNSLGNYTISGAGTIGGTGSLTKSGTGTLTLATANTYSGGTTVTAGKLLIEPTSPTTSASAHGALSISGGIVQLADNVSAGTPLGSSNVNLTSLSITGNGTLDIGNNRVIIDYSSPATDPIASIASWIKNGFYDLSGPQIISGDIATADIASGLSYGIGYADGADGAVAGLPSGEIEIMFTLLGDANLDGQVNAEDFTPFSQHLGQGGSWDGGDFNYDGTVNAEDFTPFSANLGQSASLAAAAGTLNGINLMNVPEPASTGLIVIGALGVLSNRRRTAKT